MWSGFTVDVHVRIAPQAVVLDGYTPTRNICKPAKNSYDYRNLTAVCVGAPPPPSLSVPQLDELSLQRSSPPAPTYPSARHYFPPSRLSTPLLDTVSGFTCDSSVTHHTPVPRSPRRGPGPTAGVGGGSLLILTAKIHRLCRSLKSPPISFFVACHFP